MTESGYILDGYDSDNVDVENNRTEKRNNKRGKREAYSDVKDEEMVPPPPPTW